MLSNAKENDRNRRTSVATEQFVCLDLSNDEIEEVNPSENLLQKIGNFPWMRWSWMKEVEEEEEGEERNETESEVSVEVDQDETDLDLNFQMFAMDEMDESVVELED